MKAFIVNRVGDVFFMLGLALTFHVFGSIEFDTIFAAAARHTETRFGGLPALELIGVLLFLGACGKSAQIGLHTWLPDAMEGPTPVSALIHAATMVTAGVFLMARMSPILEYAPVALAIITVVGATTALFAATIGCVQNDIKRIIAYSTCSQLGYMFFAIGVGAYQVAIFHLFTHAFFKALLFLGAGSVIHAMSDEQDIRRMGGIWTRIPVTYAVMWIGSLALAGIPFFAGYYSKDAILEAAFAAHSAVGTYAFVCGILAAFLTAFYSWRLLILTFHGKPRADHHTMEHVHESPAVMLVPLLVLATGAILTGAIFAPFFIGEHEQAFWGAAIFTGPGNHIMHAMHEVPEWVPLAPTVVGIVGIVLAYVLYMLAPGIPARLATSFRGIYLFLLNKWYFDELYDADLRPARPRPCDAALEGGRCPDHRRHAQRRGQSGGRGGTWRGPHPDRAGGELCLRDDHRPRPLRHTLPDRALRMNAAGFPLLSLLTFLPLAGAAIIMSVRGEEAVVASNARWTALWTSLIVFLLSPDPLGRLRPHHGRFPVRGTPGLAAGIRRRLPHGGRRHLGAVRPALDRADADLHPGILGIGQYPGARVHGRLPGSRDDDGRDVLRPRLHRLLRLLRSRADPDVPHHRHLGRRAAGLRGLQVLPVYPARQRADAAGDPVPLVQRRHHRHPRAVRASGSHARAQTWIFLAFLASFAVKVPMWPVHTWLPDAHVEAPTAGSVILAGVLLKMGAYGFLRFSLPLLPEACADFAPLIFVLSIVAVVYTSLVALAQEDMKKLIAYSSVAHMGIVTLGIFTFNEQGLSGALFTMLAHGVVSAALFLCVGVLYDRVHSRDILRYGGVAGIMPAYAMIFLFFTMASVGLPGLANFVGEFLVIVGAWQVNPWIAVGAASGMVLGACYMLWLYRRVSFGKITRDDLRMLLDLSPREYAVFAPLIALTLWMGVYPQPFLSFFEATVAALLVRHEAALSLSRLAGM